MLSAFLWMCLFGIADTFMAFLVKKDLPIHYLIVGIKIMTFVPFWGFFALFVSRVIISMWTWAWPIMKAV